MNGQHTRHRRHSSHPGFSHLLTTVLGSPFLTTSDLPELVDGVPVTTPFSQTIGRPSSPTPTVDSSTFSFIQFDPDTYTNSAPNRTPLKSILPRILDVLTPSRSFPASPGSSPFSYAHGYNSLKGRSKSSFANVNSQVIDYSELAPLDGEEGELIAIDDEACFFIDSSYGSHVVTGIDILGLLPAELSLHILISLCTSCGSPQESLSSILSCRSVSYTWRVLAGDNTVWRALFLARWNVDLTRRTRRRNKPLYFDAWSTTQNGISDVHLPPLAMPSPIPTRPGATRSGSELCARNGRVTRKKIIKKSMAINDNASSSSSLLKTPTSQPRYQFPVTSNSPPSPSPYRTPPPPTTLYGCFPLHHQHSKNFSDPGNDGSRLMSTVQAHQNDLANAPLQITWYQLYREHLELDRRWLGTAFQYPPFPTAACQPSSQPFPIYYGHAPQQQSHLPHTPSLPHPILPHLHTFPGPSFTLSSTLPSHASSPASVMNPQLSSVPQIDQPQAMFTRFTPEVMAIKGHSDSVYCLEFDSRRIITGSRDRTIKVWSLKDGRLLGCFGAPVGLEGSSVTATAVAGLSTGGGSTATIGVGGQAGIQTPIQSAQASGVGEYGTESGQVQGHTGSVLCLKFSADWDLGEFDEDYPTIRKRNRKERKLGFMVSGSSDCSVCVWNLWNGDQLLPIQFNGNREENSRAVNGELRSVLRGHTGGVLDLRIDDKWIVSCSKDAVIRVWDRETLALARTLRGHEGPVNAVGLQNGKVVSASGDGKMILWDITSGERMRTFEGHDRGLACIEFKGDLIVSGSNDCKIKIWSAETGECIRTLVGHEALVRALAFDPKIGRLVSASYDKTVKVWNLNNGKLVREFKNTHTSHIFDVKFDASRIVSTSHDHNIVVIDFSQGLDTSLFI